MKKNLFALVLIIKAFSCVSAQNHFPGSGNASIGLDIPLSGGAAASWLTLNGTSSYSGGNIYSINGSAKGYSYIDFDGLLTQQSAAGHKFVVNGSNPALSININANVGVGTLNPACKFDVAGSINILDNQSLTWGGAFGPGIPTIASNIGNGIYFYPAGSSISNASMRISNSGNILIGKISQQNQAYKLDVAGSMRADQITVNTTGADFVFDRSYKLLPLSTVEQYVTANHHLPEIPPARDMSMQGMDIGEMNKKLLQKVEELTLYLIAKDKQLKAQNMRLKKVEQKLKIINM